MSGAAQVIYKRIADDLRSQIASGELRVGDPIPSTSKLMELYKVSNTAARNAVGLLRNEGLVRGEAGKAVYVQATPAVVEAERADVDSLAGQVSKLREEVGQLSNQQSAEVIARIDELQTDVGRLQADLRHLYDRLGQPYPRGRSAPKTKRRSSGA